MDKYLIVNRIQDGFIVALNISQQDIHFGRKLTSIIVEKDNGIEYQETISLTIVGAQNISKLACIPNGHSAAIQLLGSGISLLRKLLNNQTRHETIILCG